MNTEKIINIDGYAIPVSVAFKIYDRVKALFCDDDAIVRTVAVIKRPSPKTPKPKSAVAKPATRRCKHRHLPPEVLKACRSIKYRAKKRDLDVVQFVRNPNLCEKRNTLQLKLSQPVKDYLLKWSVEAKKDVSIRDRFNLADLNKKPKGGK